MEYLSKSIQQTIVPITTEKVKSEKNLILEANDFIFKELRTAKGWMSWSVGIILIIVPFLISFLSKEDGYVGRIIFVSIFAVPGIGCIIYGFIAPLKYLVYNRLNDKITIPRNFRSSVDISFSGGYGIRGYSAVRPGTINQHLTFISSKEKPRVGGIITESQVDEYWAFTVWYMDKNRPLPPGTAFDPYREKDFERRKAAGFPKPLYSSNVPTPEATKEQQKERELIGGW